MPAFVKTPRFIIATLLLLWVLYMIFANFRINVIEFHLVPLVMIVMRVSSLAIASALFGAGVTLLVQWLFRRDVNIVSSVTIPPAPAPSVSVPPTNKTVA